MSNPNIEIVNAEDTYLILKSQLSDIESIEEALEQFITFFEKYKTKEVLIDDEEDMLLCQYGIYESYGDNQFCFELARQIKSADYKNIIHLSLTLLYNKESFTDIKSFESWSVDSDSMEDWRNIIYNSKGYKLSKNIKPSRIVINLEYA